MRLFKDLNDYSHVVPMRYLADGSQLPLLSVSSMNKYNGLMPFNDECIATMFYYEHDQKNRLPIRSFINLR